MSTPTGPEVIAAVQLVVAELEQARELLREVVDGHRLTNRMDEAVCLIPVEVFDRIRDLAAP